MSSMQKCVSCLGVKNLREMSSTAQDLCHLREDNASSQLKAQLLFRLSAQMHVSSKFLPWTIGIPI